MSRDDDAGERAQRALALIERALDGLQYGQVVIQVHDGTVVQVERTEKLRPGPRRG